MRFLEIISNIVSEQTDPAILKTTANKPIVDAIRNRNKITFFYTGPRKPKKDSVKQGKRFNVEPVAMGVSSKGKLILRAWVDSNSGSVTKSGFQKGNWRTFILSRMKNLTVSDETFEKRPGYREDGDSKMNPVYVQTSFKDKKDIEKKEKPQPTPTEPEITKPEPKKPETVKPEPITKKEPEVEKLPEPKPEEKPDQEPTKDIEGDEISNKEKELPEPKPQEKPPVNPEEDEEENNNLQESIKRIKTLMFF